MRIIISLIFGLLTNLAVLSLPLHEVDDLSFDALQINHDCAELMASYRLPRPALQVYRDLRQCLNSVQQHELRNLLIPRHENVYSLPEFGTELYTATTSMSGESSGFSDQLFYEGGVVLFRYRVISLYVAHGERSQIYDAHDVKSNQTVIIKVVYGEVAGHGSTLISEIMKPWSLQDFAGFSRNIPFVFDGHHNQNLLNDVDASEVELRETHIMHPLRFHKNYEADCSLEVYPFYDQDWHLLAAKADRFDPRFLRKLQRLTRDMLTALSYLKWKGLVHADIKAHNIFYNSSTGDSYLGDFDLIVKAGTTSDYRVGTKEFMAPEVILHRQYLHATDIWSLGVTLFKLLTHSKLLDSKMRRRNFSIDDYLEQLLARVPMTIGDSIEMPPAKSRRQERLDIKTFNEVMFDYELKGDPLWNQQESNLFGNLADFIGRCLKWDPSNRITVESALLHPFIVS